jgi:hypothetical protein
LAALRVRYRGARCPVSLFFSGVRRLRAAVRRVQLCARVSGGRCIPRDSLLPARARWASVRRFLLREPPVRAAVREVRRDVLVSAMFRAA